MSIFLIFAFASIRVESANSSGLHCGESFGEANLRSETQGTTRKRKHRRRRRSRYIPPKKVKYSTAFEILSDTILATGVQYKKIAWGGKYKHNFHLIEIDLDTSKVYLKTLKAGNTNTSIDKLQNIVHNFDSLYIDSVLVAVNANFWRAYTNYPIGPTIVDGELVEMKTHKNWTSGLFDAHSHLYIDNFFISGTMQGSNNSKFKISNVNRRRDTNGVVLYNQFAGEVVPYISASSIAKDVKDAIVQALSEVEFMDSTDFELDSVSLINEVIAKKQMSSTEFHNYKSACHYITGPAVNKETQAIVMNLSLGLVNMPLNGFIISYGKNINIDKMPKPGDTISVKFATNVYDSVVFYNSVSGAPRLVRNGKAKHEARREGLRSRRFINMQLPRTAIGTSKDKSKIFIIAVEYSSRSKHRVGASLANLTKIMKRVGAYDAMNLDGGGSTIMVIDGKNILLPEKPDASRRISVGLGVILDK